MGYVVATVPGAEGGHLFEGDSARRGVGQVALPVGFGYCFQDGHPAFVGPVEEAEGSLCGDGFCVLISHGLMERVNDFAHEGRQVLASRLGYRITSTFVDRFLGRMFESPRSVFTDEMLRPEKQDLVAFAEGVDAICEAQQRVAAHYFEDGSVADACPPIRALLHIMRDGHFEGKDVHAPEIRGMFTREALVASDWYRARLMAKQRRDVAFWTVQGDAAQAARVSAAGYLEELVGTIGADPSAVG